MCVLFWSRAYFTIKQRKIISNDKYTRDCLTFGKIKPLIFSTARLIKLYVEKCNIISATTGYHNYEHRKHIGGKIILYNNSQLRLWFSR